jgi:hypothetical protein
LHCRKKNHSKLGFRLFDCFRSLSVGRGFGLPGGDLRLGLVFTSDPKLVEFLLGRMFYAVEYGLIGTMDSSLAPTPR